MWGSSGAVCRMRAHAPRRAQHHTSFHHTSPCWMESAHCTPLTPTCAHNLLWRRRALKDARRGEG
jgi:hypothetical protein